MPLSYCLCCKKKKKMGDVFLKSLCDKNTTKQCWYDGINCKFVLWDICILLIVEFLESGDPPAVHLHSSLSNHLNEFFEFPKDCTHGAKYFYQRVKAAAWKSIWPLYLGGGNKINKTVFSPNILYCSDPGCSAIQFTHSSKQQCDRYQKTSTQRVCVWKLGPTSPQQTVTDYLEVLRTFLVRGKCCNEGKEIHVKTRSSPVRSPVQTGSPTTVSCNTLWFPMKHQDETNDTAVTTLTRSNFWILIQGQIL